MTSPRASRSGPAMLAQQLLNGFLSGAVYALFALGFTLMFGVLGVINLTYGLYFSTGAFIALYATNLWACRSPSRCPLQRWSPA